jgi:hypothetical protein
MYEPRVAKRVAVSFEDDRVTLFKAKSSHKKAQKERGL